MAGFTFQVTVDSSDLTFTLPTLSGQTYNATVEWSDSTTDTITAYDDPDITHTFPSAGTYTGEIKGTFGGLSFDSSGDYQKFVAILYHGDPADFDGFNWLRSGFAGTPVSSTGSGAIQINNSYGLIRAFRNCSNNASVNSDLFDDASSVRTLEGFFHNNTSLVTFPSGLLDSLTQCNNFQSFIEGGSSLESLPSLFFANTAVNNLAYGFLNCNKLQLRSDIFYAPEDRDTRFLNVSVSFYNAFRIGTFTGTKGLAPDIWKCDYGTGTPNSAYCFLGHSLASVDNYNGIPAAWGGPTSISDPSISSVSDSTVTDGQNITITGNIFCYDCDFYLTDNADWDSSTVFVLQTLNSVTETGADIDIDFGALSAGTAYLHAEHYRDQNTGSGGLEIELTSSSGNSCVVSGILSPLSFSTTIAQINAAQVDGTLSALVADVQAAQHNSALVDAALPVLSFETEVSQTNAATVDGVLNGPVGDVQAAQTNPIEVDAALPVLSFETTLQQHNAALVDALLPVLGFNAEVEQHNSITVDGILPSLVFSVFGNNVGGNSCIVSFILPIPVADIQASQENSIIVDAALPALTADITAEQHNLIQVQGIIDALGFSATVTQENLCQVDGTIQALQFATEITQENAAAVDGILSPLSFSASALVGNVAQVNMILPVFGFDVTVTQENAITVDGILPSLIADIIILPEESEDAYVVWRETRGIELKQIPYGTDAAELSFNMPPSWNVKTLESVSVSIADRAGNEVLAAEECTLWPDTTLDGAVKQYADSFVLSAGATAPLNGDMLTIDGFSSSETVTVKDYDIATRTVTTESMLESAYDDGDDVYGNVVSYELDVSDTDTFTAGKTFVATWTPVGTGIPIKTLLEITKFEADTSNFEQELKDVYPRVYDSFKSPVDRFARMLAIAQRRIQTELKHANMDYNRITGEPVLKDLLLAKMACLWANGNADEDLADERKELNKEYTAMFATLKDSPVWTDSDQDGTRDESAGEITSHTTTFGRSW